MLVPMQVCELNIYPIKSTRAITLDTATVEPWGLSGDRRWVLVDAEGIHITAREEPALLTISSQLVPGGLLLDDLWINEPSGERVPIRIHDSDLFGIPAGSAADEWFTSRLRRPDVRLVWCDDPTQRQLEPGYALIGDSTGFADGYPLLLTNAASLRQLNDWIAEGAVERGELPNRPLPMSRFRPNVVVSGAEPFAEDTWKRIRIGVVEFRVPKPCARCVMTTVDERTLERGKEPIRTLARHRRWDGKTWFGMNLIPDGVGEIRLGDPVEILD
jgi:uncharacterized protein YcbX